MCWLLNDVILIAAILCFLRCDLLPRGPVFLVSLWNKQFWFLLLGSQNQPIQCSYLCFVMLFVRVIIELVSSQVAELDEL